MSYLLCLEFHRPWYIQLLAFCRSKHICDNDYLEVHHNGLSEKVCGQRKVKKAVISGESFTLTFYSGNMKIGGTGFIMTYITKTAIREQLQRIIKKKQGFLISFFYCLFYL